MKFGSWTYDGTKLDLFFYQNLTEFSLSDYIEATEWHITKNMAKKSEKFYDVASRKYDHLIRQLLKHLVSLPSWDQH
jgi:hypothetical protein